MRPKIPRVEMTAGLDEDKRNYMVFGYTTTGSFKAPFRNDDEMRYLWGRYKKRILAASGTETDCGFWGNCLLGSRPWCWWKFDAPEPRRTTGVAGTGPMSKGMPRYHANQADADMYESERAYLTRLGLLTEREIQAVPA